MICCRSKRGCLPRRASVPARRASVPARRASVPACSCAPNASGRSAQSRMPVPPTSAQARTLMLRRASVPLAQACQTHLPVLHRQESPYSKRPACSGVPNPSGRSAQARMPVPPTSAQARTLMLRRASVPACSGVPNPSASSAQARKPVEQASRLLRRAKRIRPVRTVKNARATHLCTSEDAYAT